MTQYNLTKTIYDVLINLVWFGFFQPLVWLLWHWNLEVGTKGIRH